VRLIGDTNASCTRDYCTVLYSMEAHGCLLGLHDNTSGTVLCIALGAKLIHPPTVQYSVLQYSSLTVSLRSLQYCEKSTVQL